MIKNMKIRTRMLLSYAVIIVLCLAASIIALFMMNKISGNLTSFYDNNYTVTVNAWTARREMQYARADILKAIIETDVNDTKAAIDSASDALTKMRDTFPLIRERFKGDKALMDEVETILQQAMGYRDQVFDLALALRNDEAFALMKNSYAPLLDQMADVLREIATEAENDAIAMVEQGRQLQTTSMLVVIAVIGFSIALAVVLGLYISNGIRKPVEEIKEVAEKMAAGNLDVSLDYQSRDELGNLSDSMRSLIHMFREIIDDMSYGLASLGSGDFTVESKVEELYVGDFHRLLTSMHQIIERLSQTLGQISMASDQVSAGSDQVSAGSQALSQGATEQASSVEELAATINEISSQVSENAENAQQGSKLADAAGAKIELGNRQMQEMIAAMGEISDKSGQIGKIIKTIEDIAFQTNILALNAAVEAAQGFAVVADEVRNLASKSAEASKSTAALIEGSIQAVERGTSLADETANTLSEVVVSAKQVVAVVDNISRASSEQALSIAQVTQGIDQISSVVQTNSATAEESAAASEELSGQAQMLKNLVEKFKLRNTETAGKVSSIKPLYLAETAEPLIGQEKY
ncbi:methyl-accepting chemotaxis protein [Enterocloster bolteae]|uniref:methyl-accepting chemotaxis protein n=1 Tax=Enterocloster bolteae TaxID=208479 RepID=UPI0026775567|nr:methyl-accepting chemotaxis protein [Enterocloster bolteae]